MSGAKNGFTLKELAMVLAVAGILGAICVPKYQHYTQSAKFSELVMATAPLKTALSLCAKAGECVNGAKWGEAGPRTDVLVGPDLNGDKRPDSQTKLPLPQRDSKVIHAALGTGVVVSGHGTPILSVRFNPLPGDGILASDSLIFQAELRRDGTVSYSVSPASGCRLRSHPIC